MKTRCMHMCTSFVYCLRDRTLVHDSVSFSRVAWQRNGFLKHQWHNTACILVVCLGGLLIKGRRQAAHLSFVDLGVAIVCVAKEPTSVKRRTNDNYDWAMCWKMGDTSLLVVYCCSCWLWHTLVARCLLQHHNRRIGAHNKQSRSVCFKQIPSLLRGFAFLQDRMLGRSADYVRQAPATTMTKSPLHLDSWTPFLSSSCDSCQVATHL